MTTRRNSSSKDVGNINSGVMLCSTKEFLKEHKKSCFYLALMSKQVQEMGKMSSISHEIQPLLK
jgi:hypothetical protein